MATQQIGLIWIVVNDLHASVKFYTEVVGLKLETLHDEDYGWAELSSPQGGARLGIARKSAHEPILPGQNAVVTFTVDNLSQSIKAFVTKGAKLVGDVMEVPGHVKMQMVVDLDANHFQLVELLSH